jgi:hypothetical protein
VNKRNRPGQRRGGKHMKTVCILWLIFTIMFTALGILSYCMSRNSVREIKPFVRPLANMVSVQIAGADADAPIRAFLVDFNEYIRSYNKSTRLQNIIACAGYVLAAITSGVSFFLAGGRIKF